MTIINLQEVKEDRSPHISGKARCVNCNHEWVAVAPVGTTWLECPSCSFLTGHFYYAVERDGEHWNCNCGNRLFCITREGIYCPNCGEYQNGF